MQSTLSILMSKVLVLGVVVPWLCSPTRGTELEEGAIPVWTLEDLVAITLRENPEAAIALHKIEVGQAFLNEAKAGFWPRLSVQSALTQSDNPAQALMASLNQQSFDPAGNLNRPGDTENMNVAGVLSVPIYQGGALHAGLSKASRLHESAMHDRETWNRRLILQVILAFNETQKRQAFLETAQKTVEAYRSHLAVAEKRFSAGALLLSEKLDLETKSAESLEMELQAENEMLKSFEHLKFLMGIEIGPFSLAPHVWPIAINSTSLESVERHEMKSAKSQLKAAEAEVRIQKASLKPSLQGFVRMDHNQGWRSAGSDLSYTTGIALNWDVWDRSLRKSRVSRAESNLEMAKERERQTKLLIQLESIQAKLDWESTLKRVEVAESAVRAAESSVMIIRARFQEGSSLSSEVIDSESTLTGARFRLIQAQTDRASAWSRLRHALGLEMLPEWQQNHP